MTANYNFSEFNGLLQNDLNVLHTWCVQNKMNINLTKTVVIRFGKSDDSPNYSINGKVIVCTKETKDLGLVIDNKLNFQSHCLKVVKKANFFCYNVLRAFRYSNLDNKFFVFKLYIRPIIEYGIMFYFPYLKKLQSLIEKIHRGFTKRICPHGLSYSQRLQLLSDVSVEHI